MHDDMHTDTAAGRFSARYVVVIAVVAAVLGGAVGYLASGGGGSPGPSLAPPTGPSTSLEPLVQLRLGQTGTTNTGAEVTVLTWDEGRPPYWPPNQLGNVYSRAEVRFCTGEGTWNFRIREIPYLFNLVDEAGNIYDPFVDVRHSVDELASYNTGLISPNECVEGSVIFAEPPGVDIRAVRFTGNGRFEWDVSAISNGSPAPSPPYHPGGSVREPASPSP